jgi:hypothetical protein
MKESVDKLDIYNNSAIILEKKTPKGIISWITILIIFLIIFLTFSFIPFNVYKPFVGYLKVDINKVLFISYIEYSDFPVVKNKKLYIKDKEYKYEVVSIEDNVLTLKIDLDDDIKIHNNTLVANILEKRTTIFNIIINKLKKGLMK